MKLRFALPLFLLLTLAASPALRAQDDDNDTGAPATEQAPPPPSTKKAPAKVAPVKAPPKAPAPAVAPPEAAAPPPSPSAPVSTAPVIPAVSTPEAAAPAPAVSTETAAAPAVSTAAAAPAPAPMPAMGKDVVNCATYTRDLAKLYEDLAADAKAYTSKSQEQVQLLKMKEAEIQGKLDTVNKDIGDKSADKSREAQKEVKALKKEAKALGKELYSAQKESRRMCDTVLEQMWAMQKRHLDAIKAKYKDVESLVKASQE